MVTVAKSGQWSGPEAGICKWDQYNIMYNVDQFSHILIYIYIDNFVQHVQF